MSLVFLLCNLDIGDFCKFAKLIKVGSKYFDLKTGMKNDGEITLPLGFGTITLALYLFDDILLSQRQISRRHFKSDKTYNREFQSYLFEVDNL